MDRRTLLSAVGLGVAGAGLLVALAPGLADRLAANFSLIFAIAAASIVLGLRDVLARARTDVEAYEPTDYESAVELPAPGRRFRERLQRARGRSPFRSQRLHWELRERLTDLAIATLVETEDCSRERAEHMLSAGTWTEDPVAAEFFATTGEDPAALAWFELLLGRDTGFESGVEHVVDALLARMEDSDVTPTSGPDSVAEEGSP